MDAGILHTEIEKVCPVVSTKMGDTSNRATWSFEPATDATSQQIDAGNNVIATIPMDTQPPPSPPKAALYDHENRIRALEGQAPLALKEFEAKTRLG